MAGDEPGKAPGRGELMAQAVEAIVSFQDAADALDEAASQFMGLARSEVRCLGALQRGPRSASDLADRLYLTRGAITALVDRLEAKGLVERRHVSDDRRRVYIAITPHARRMVTSVWGPLAAEGASHVKNYDDDQLATIADFLAAGRDLQLRHAARVRAMTPPGDEGPEGASSS